jgi:hypothetical protein
MANHKYVSLAVLLAFCASLLNSCQPAIQTTIPTEKKSPALIPITGENSVNQPTNTIPVLPSPTVIRKAVTSNTVDTPLQNSTAAPPTTAPTTTGITASPTTLRQVPALNLPPEEWKSWPVQPQLAEELKAVYRRGLEQGNDPRAFSILGDCQSQPDVFMGIYDDDPNYVRTLSAPLQETIHNFAGSFDRYSPTVKDATTEGALLWIQWNDNKEKKCAKNESPIDCELRTHRPSLVFVHVGTHWEARNRHYLEISIQKILARGAIPILVTKADNREKDERVNQDMASLAAQYHLPLWNFWASVHHLPNNGLKPDSDMYLGDEGLAIHRMGALEALDVVWRSLQD